MTKETLQQDFEEIDGQVCANTHIVQFVTYCLYCRKPKLIGRESRGLRAPLVTMSEPMAVPKETFTWVEFDCQIPTGGSVKFRASLMPNDNDTVQIITRP